MSELRAKHLHFDCISGIAGDMSLGAFVDLGVPKEVILDAIAALGISTQRVSVSSCIKSGIACVDVKVEGSADFAEEAKGQNAHSHEHSSEEHSSGEQHHHHGEHEAHEHRHYHYSEIRDRIQKSSLSSDIVAMALAIFDRVAEAEAKLHGSSVEKVAFHEVGAVDSIVDVVGAAAALVWLAPASVSASSVAMGEGQIRCAHGILPVPSPAALEIMKNAGALVHGGGVRKELCTPTGAAILAACVEHWGSMPSLKTLAIGYGAGDVELPDRPNLVRILVGQKAETQKDTEAALHSDDEVLQIECNLDDMSPELCGHLTAKLMSLGALDALWAPIYMKKGRPAMQLQVLSSPAKADELMGTIVRESSAIGLRFSRKQRRVLRREMRALVTKHGEIQMKLAYLGDELVNLAPEYESCVELAQRSKRPLKEIFASAFEAWGEVETLKK